MLMNVKMFMKHCHVIYIIKCSCIYSRPFIFIKYLKTISFIFLMDLVCDYRERHVLKRLEQCLLQDKDKYNNISIKKENLVVGDFQIGNMIFERKTHQDLASSILDGRYQEQSNRLVEHGTNNPHLKIVYIVEGNLDLYFNQHNIDKDKIMSSVMSLFYEKGFQVLLTKHINETSDYLLKFCLKYYTKYAVQGGGGGECEDGEDSSSMVSNSLICLPKKKSSQIHKDNIGILMLCNVPHISAHVATQLLAPFDNQLGNFLQKIKDDSSYLETIKIITQGKDKKERKLAKNIRTTLVEYFG
jgi:ERCC4-type nuclease